MIRLKSSEAADYSRYLFFYVNYLIHKKRFDLVKEISFEIDELSSNLIILQTKSWIDKSNLMKLKKYFLVKMKMIFWLSFFI